MATADTASKVHTNMVVELEAALPPNIPMDVLEEAVLHISMAVLAAS